MIASDVSLALCVTSHEMNILWCDDAYLEVLGQERLDLVGSNVIEHTHPENRASNLELLNALRSGGPPFSVTKRYLRPDGRSVWVRNHVSAFRDGMAPTRIFASVETLLTLESHDALLLERAERAIRRRRARMIYLQPETVSEGSVDVLLDLFVHHIRRRQISVSSACLAARVPATTALRHIERLIVAGLVERQQDPNDGRRFLLDLTEEGAERVTSYLRYCES